MRIGVLEWASCGGQPHVAALPASIRHEGWAMCQAVMSSLSSAGVNACSIVWPDLRDQVHQLDRLQQLHTLVDHGPTIRQQWQQLFGNCDATLVIAPECDGILSELISWARQQQWQLINCDEPFVHAASDKWLTAQQLWGNHVRHPATYLLSDTQLDQLDLTDYDTWVIKPRDGVGCEGIRRTAARDLHTVIKGYHDQLDRWILQPWLPGQAFSRAAIVDQQGQQHWLPIMRQQLHVDKHVSYQGGQLEVLDEPIAIAMGEYFDRAIKALGGRARGWVGVDFLWDPAQPQLAPTIIEINPRLTTSFVGLAAGYSRLARELAAAALGQAFVLPGQWPMVRFTIDARGVEIAL